MYHYALVIAFVVAVYFIDLHLLYTHVIFVAVPTLVIAFVVAFYFMGLHFVYTHRFDCFAFQFL